MVWQQRFIDSSLFKPEAICLICIASKYIFFQDSNNFHSKPIPNKADFTFTEKILKKKMLLLLRSWRSRITQGSSDTKFIWYYLSAIWSNGLEQSLRISSFRRNGLFARSSRFLQPKRNYFNHLLTVLWSIATFIFSTTNVFGWFCGVTLFTIFTNPSARAGYVTRLIFKRSLTSFNSEFSFS